MRRFDDIIRRANMAFKHNSYTINPTMWQGREVSGRPESTMVEVLNFIESYKFSLEDEVWKYSDIVKPNQPWADNHFKERVCGYPINPGIEWANWPWGTSAEGSLENGKFNHNYMERYWPKFAGKIDIPTINISNFKIYSSPLVGCNKGIRYEYGDLEDLINLLAKEPDTRQAYLPIFFPEDTGKIGTRKPCSLGYHFMIRGNILYCNYFLRSCDYAHHFRDDIYLTMKLMEYIQKEVEKLTNLEVDIHTGVLTFHICSFHMFINDYIKLFGEKPNENR